MPPGPKTCSVIMFKEEAPAPTPTPASLGPACKHGLRPERLSASFSSVAQPPPWPWAQSCSHPPRSLLPRTAGGRAGLGPAGLLSVPNSDTVWREKTMAAGRRQSTTAAQGCGRG